MPQNFLLPDVGGGSAFGIADIYVKVGDNISQGDNFLMLESDKATVDLPSSYSGVVKEIVVNIGDQITVGQLIAVIKIESGDIKSNIDGKPPISKTSSNKTDTKTEDLKTSDEVAYSRPQSSLGSTVYASPYIRRLARKLNINLSQLKGSGRHNRITEDDLLVANNHFTNNINNQSIVASPLPDFSQFGSVKKESFTRIQQLSSSHLTRCWQTIPHVTQCDYADITDLEKYRNSLNKSQSDVKYTLLAFIISACCYVLKKYPKFNASLDGNQIIYKHYYNIGFAVDTSQGLVVAVIKNVNEKGLSAIASEIVDLAHKARAGKLEINDMQGGCFTISSLGGYGVKSHFTPIINAPEVAILGVSTATNQAVFDGASFQPKLMLPLSVSYDHRIIDGALAAQFTHSLSCALADLRNILL